MTQNLSDCRRLLRHPYDHNVEKSNLVFEDGVGALHEQRLDQVTPVLLDGHV